jgi:UDP-3-O-[3-hydroxymyristoyl] glucosamine N-acyltransferase
VDYGYRAEEAETKQPEDSTMPDRRFFHRAGPFRLQALAEQIGAEPPDSETGQLLIHDVATLETARPGEISVFNDKCYAAALAKTRAGAVVTDRDFARHVPSGMRLLVVDEPRLAYAQIGHLFYPSPALEPGIDISARVDEGAVIGTGCRIDAGVVIGQGVEIGMRCHIAANAVLGTGVVLGDDCRIGANTTISYALLGTRVEIATGVSIGSQGFGFVRGPRGLVRMLQLGRVLIEDDVGIGANCAIDRGATGDTVIGAGTVLDNLVHIGHNVRLGRHCIICGQVGIAGSTVVGDDVMMGGQVGVSDHLTIGSGARIAAKSGVIRDVAQRTSVGGFPAVALRQWHRQTTALARMSGRRHSDDAEE